MSTRVWAFAVFISLLARAGWARAEEVPRPAPVRLPSPAPASHWYGWQTLATDAGGATLIAASAVPEGRHQYILAGSLVVAGLTTLVLGAPVVHAAHDRWGAAAASLALRTVLPGLAVLAASQPCSGECNGSLLLLAVAVTAPVVLDASALSWQRDSQPPLAAESRLRIRPYATVNRSSFSAGIVAAF